MKKKVLMGLCCLLLVLVTACGNPKLENGEEVIVSIDGKEISADELYEELKKEYGYTKVLTIIDQYIAEKEIETTDEIKKEAQDLVDYYVEYAASANVDLETFLTGYLGITGISTEEEFLEFIISDYKVSLAITEQVKTMFGDEEIEDYYNENYSEQITVRHILIEIEESDTDGKKAKEQAEDLIKELKEADKDKLEEKFSELAEEYSDDSSYANGGLIENIMSSTVVPEFWEASEDLKNGEYTTKPVLTDYGYHVIYRVSSGDKPALKDVKDEVLTALAEEALGADETLYYTAMNALREKYGLKFYDTDLQTSYDEYLKQLES